MRYTYYCMDIGYSLVIFLLNSWPFWLTIVAVILAWRWWLRFRNRRFIENIKWVVLEIRIPKELSKSPFAMEMALANALSQTGGVGTWVKRYWDGNLVNWFSLELVSLGGDVRFFIRANKNFKMIVENQIYAQYPQAEITEVEDYVNTVMGRMHKEPWSMFGSNFVLSKEDPFPIKTYIDFNLDQAVEKLKEEQRVDPITPVIELLGSMRPDEHMWFQILVRPAQKRYKKPGTWFSYGDWKDEGKDIIKKLKKDLVPGEESIKQLTRYEQDLMTAIERNITKQGFDVGVRCVYLTPKEMFDSNRIAAMLGAFKQYSTPHWNGFKPDKSTSFDYPWQDPTGRRTLNLKREMFDAYVRRSYFYEPYKEKPFVLNSEELATIYHFPGAVSETPQLKRIESKKAEPPVNLPV